MAFPNGSIWDLPSPWLWPDMSFKGGRRLRLFFTLVGARIGSSDRGCFRCAPVGSRKNYGPSSEPTPASKMEICDEYQDSEENTTCWTGVDGLAILRRKRGRFFIAVVGERLPVPNEIPINNAHAYIQARMPGGCDALFVNRPLDEQARRFSEQAIRAYGRMVRVVPVTRCIWILSKGEDAMPAQRRGIHPFLRRTLEYLLLSFST